MLRYISLFFILIASVYAEDKHGVLSMKINPAEYEFSEISRISQGQAVLYPAKDGDVLSVERLTSSMQTASIPKIQSATPAFQGDLFFLTDFANSSVNRLGGFFYKYAQAPSSVTVTMEIADDQRRVCRVSYQKKETGACLFGMNLFDSSLPVQERIYMDAAPYSTISFWMRCVGDPCDLVLKVADARLAFAEENSVIGPLGTFLPSGKLSSAWQLVTIPFTKIPPTVNKNQLASLILEPSGNGNGAAEIAQVAFGTEAGQRIALPPPLASRKKVPDPENALWVWNTHFLIQNPQDETLFRMLERFRVTTIYMQIPACLDNQSESGVLDEMDIQLAKLISRISRLGITVHGLDGDKSYALPENHTVIQKRIQSVINYNQQVKPEERFSGIHLDIEPHLLPEFRTGKGELILTNFLQGLQKCGDMTKRAGLRIGADIPFWYDAVDEISKQKWMIDYNGKKQSIAYHVIDLMDTVTIMDYRTEPFGADGNLSLALGVLRYASTKQKKIRIGLETAEVADYTAYSFHQLPKTGLPDQLTEGTYLFFTQSEADIQAYFVPFAQYESFRKKTGSVQPKPDKILYWRLSNPALVNGDKLSFCRLGFSALMKNMEKAQFEFCTFSAFTGFAIHDSVSLIQLIK